MSARGSKVSSDEMDIEVERLSVSRIPIGFCVHYKVHSHSRWVFRTNATGFPVFLTGEVLGELFSENMLS